MDFQVRQQLELLQIFFDGAIVAPVQKLAPVLGMARQTARNKACAGTLPFHTVKIGGARCARLIDVAVWLASLAPSPFPADKTQPTAATPAKLGQAEKRGRGRPRRVKEEAHGAAKGGVA